MESITEKQAMAKIREMNREHSKTVIKECKRLLKSGGINISDYENNYVLPKILFHVALLNEAFQYKPHSKENIKECENLKHF